MQSEPLLTTHAQYVVVPYEYQSKPDTSDNVKSPDTRLFMLEH